MTRSELVTALACRSPQLVIQDAEQSVKEILAALSGAMEQGGIRQVSDAAFVQAAAIKKIIRMAAVGRLGEVANGSFGAPKFEEPRFR